MNLEEGLARLEQIHKEITAKNVPKEALEKQELPLKLNPNQSFLYKKMSEKYKFMSMKKPASRKEEAKLQLQDWSKAFIGDWIDSKEDDVPF